MTQFNRFYPARFHEKGPGEWGVCDREREDKIIYVHGKMQAYLIAHFLDKHGIPEGWENAISAMFERRSDDHT